MKISLNRSFRREGNQWGKRDKETWGQRQHNGKFNVFNWKLDRNEDTVDSNHLPKMPKSKIPSQFSF